MNVCCQPKPSSPNDFLASHFVFDKTMCFLAGQEVRKDSKETWTFLDKSPFGFFFGCSADLLCPTICNYLLSKGRRYLCGQWFYHLVALPYHSKKLQNSTTHELRECPVHRITDIWGVLGWCIAEPIPPKNYTSDFASFCQNVRVFFDSHALRTILSNICPGLVPCAWQLSKTQCHKRGTHELSWEVR